MAASVSCGKPNNPADSGWSGCEWLKNCEKLRKPAFSDRKSFAILADFALSLPSLAQKTDLTRIRPRVV